MKYAVIGLLYVFLAAYIEHVVNSQTVVASVNTDDKSSNVQLNAPTVTTNKPDDSDIIVHDHIVNPHDFNYLINPEYKICGEKQDKNRIFLLIYVHTAPSNFKRRLSIRETWARPSMFRDIRIVFMMGYSDDYKTKNQLQLESAIYNDIVQEDFIDSYKNLTFKGIMAMKWISKYCNHSKYILKVDDDIISNIFILIRHLNSMDNYNLIKEKTIMCLVWVGMVVMRDKNSKWYLSKEEFKDDVYGKYCSGSAYILSGDLPKHMYNTSFYVKFFWVDDYYITGLLARGVNVTYEFFNSLYIISSGLVEQRFIGKQSDHTVFGHIPGTLNKMYSIWDYIIKNQLIYHPSLYKSNAKLIEDDDFRYLKNFKWSYSIWDKFLKPTNPDEDWIDKSFQKDSY